MQNDIASINSLGRPVLKPNMIPHLNLDGGQRENRYCDVQCQTDPDDFPLSFGKKRKIVEMSSSTSQKYVDTPSRVPVSNQSIYIPIERDCEQRGKVDEHEDYDEFDEFDNYVQSECTEHDDSRLTANERITICELTMKLMEGDSLYYTGIPNESSNVIDMIVEKSTVSKRNLFLILRKIRHNETFKILGDLFGLSYRQAGKIFISDIDKIAACLKPLISPPQSSYIYFKHKYPYVQIIINCFEISIGNPSNTIDHSFGWSQNKHSNTVKYLIGCTPNGVIIFISKGFPGRISDNEIVRRSGFLNIVKTNTYVTADSGFKDIDSGVFSKKGILFKSPGASADVINTSEEAKMCKSIATERIDAGSVFGKMRNFAFLKPHDLLLSYKRTVLIEYAIIIVSAMCNMQGLFTKK